MMLAGSMSVGLGCSSNEGGIAGGGSAGSAGGATDAASEIGETEGSVLPSNDAAVGDPSSDAADTSSPVDEPDAALRPVCVFHTAPTVDMDASVPEPMTSSAVDAAARMADADTDGASNGSSDAGALSEAGSASDASRPRDGAAEAAALRDITIESSGFPYLADGAGRALYIYAADTPGDCQQAPVSVCENDCAIAWPIFDAKKRRLAPGLDDALFGSIRRADGTDHTTYRGWPLYYYKPDTARGMVTGQGKGKVWFLATVLPFGMTIMKTGRDLRVTDGTGRTVYTYDQDTKGGELADPVSACAGDCLNAYPPVLQNRISVIASLEPNDFSLFLRKGTTRMQLAYKGAPLYYATADVRLGEMNGVMPGWSIVAP